MKAILIKLCIGVLLLSALSCDDDLPVYEDVSRVYFLWVLDGASNKRIVSLGYDTPMKSDSTIRIKVKLLGRVSDQDRPVTAEVIRSESTAVLGENFEFLPSVIPAGRDTGSLCVKILNTDTLLKTTLSARIRLTPNESFHVDLSQGGRLEYNIEFDAQVNMPNLWKDAANMNNYWGAWSRPKEMAIYAALGVEREFFTYHPENGEDANTILSSRISSMQVAQSMIGIVNRWLNSYKAGTTYMDGTKKSAGEPLRDGTDGKSGNEVKTGLPSVF